MASTKSHTKSSSSGSSFSIILGFQKSLEKGSFGVLYAMIKGNTFPKILTILSLLIEFCQLSSFGFKHQYPWGGDAGYYLKKIMSPVSHPSNLVGYTGFQILFWVVVGLMVLGFINIWYVAYQFYQGKIANIWIIRTLRWFVSTSVAVLYIPILSLLLIGLDCTTSDSGRVLRKFEAESIQCFRGANLPISIVSIILIIIFSIVAFISSATYYEYDTTVKSRFAKPHARFDVSILLVKTIFAFFNSLVDFVPWLTSITFFVLMLCLTIASIVVLPYNNQRLNQIKSGFYTVVLWVSFMTLVTMGLYDETSPATSYIAVAGVFPAFPIGYFLNRFYYKWLSSQVVNLVIPQPGTSSMDLREKKEKHHSTEKVESSPTSKITWGKEPITLGSKRQIIFPFFENKLVFSFFVEIMARKILRGSFGDGISNSSNDAIERANNLYQCGLQYFPKSDILWMAYCNFLFTVRKDRHIGYAALEKLRRMKPSFDVRFFIYQRDKEREQLMDSDLRGPENGGKIQDFVSYMEFKKLYYGAKRHHVKCLNYIKRFWGHLLHETVDLHRLSDLSGRIATTENKANESYERLLALNPNSVRVLRDYSQFLEEVVKDKDSALRLQKKAEAIEDLMSKSQTTDFKISDIKTLDDSDNELNEPNAIQLAKIDAEISKTHSSGSKSNDTKSKDDSSDTSGSSRGRRSKYREFQQSNAISKLSWLMIATTAACIIFLIVVLIVFRGLAVKHNNAYQGILSITDCATEAVKIAINLNTMQAYSLGESALGAAVTKALVDQLRAENDRSVIIMKNIHDAIYWGEGNPTSYVGDNLSALKAKDGYPVFDIGSKVFPYEDFNRTNSVINNAQMITLYNEPSVNMTILINPSGANITTRETYDQLYNAWKAGNTFIDSAVLANTLTVSQLQAASLNSNFKFVVLNAPTTIPNIYIKIQQTYINALLSGIMNTLNTILYVWLGIFCFLFLIAILLFRPVVTKISREKIRTLVLFSLAPRDVVIRLASKKIKMTSLDSGSERDNLFDTTDDDVSARGHDHLHSDGETGTRKKNDSTSISITVSDPKGSSHPIILGSDNEINKSRDDVERSSAFGDRRPLIDSNGLLGSTAINRKHVQSQQENNEEVKPLLSSDDKKYGWDGKSKRNLNKKSLRSVLRRLHWSYIVAIFLLFGFITMGIWVTFSVVFANSQSGFTLGQSCTRALDSRIINYYVAELYTYDGDANTKDALTAVTQLQNNHQSLPYLEEVRPLMEGSYGCWLLNKTKCIPSNSPYYEDTSKGLDWLIDQYTKHVVNLANTDPNLSSSSPELAWMQAIGSDYIFQGLDLATYIYFKHYQENQNWATMVLTTILAITSVILLIVYVVLFRPFMNHLRIQHIHTLALLRLAPDDIRHMEVSDKVIDED
ncbi:hypothetical protein DICPUDRAFT_42359 [Dictyostelium purpureum]|uniref:TmcB/TmcC TPR repeats domain-containing protein n=1 Tax=Dictyostelium purpureum TaxID=5786 RepID=F1A1W7_DICPU|nr:uncharacterized protein DICPUDRAFT_42359 [Dictyostelium purpureum]EGC29812.1 hypothetical protein DICPUDRAFT_42359 [Dictyostelium purpureum]|eukprot:XP_003293660.1 hypothetical protein DICPUDRAFT_42359 [Dictyostelium purpureum]